MTEEPKNQRTEELKNRGFTLVEMLMAATIFSIIAAGMALSFMSGMRLWARAQRQEGALAEALLTLERMAREVRQSVDVPAIGFGGTASEVSFPCLVGDSVVQLTYAFDRSNKTLRRRQVGLKEIIEERLQPEVLESLLLIANDVALDYASVDKEHKRPTGAWQEEWDQDDGVPPAIRLRIQLKDDTVTKTIFIPINFATRN